MSTAKRAGRRRRELALALRDLHVILRIAAVANGDRNEATSRVQGAFSEAGAWLTDVHFFSGVQTVFAFEVAVDRLGLLRAALEQRAIALNEASVSTLDEAAAQAQGGDIEGTLAVTFVGGDPDLERIVLAVPGR